MTEETKTEAPDPTSTPTPTPPSQGGDVTDVTPPSDDGGDPDRPDWLPEKFWDAESKAPNIENLAKSYAEIEKTRGKDLEKLKEEWETQRIAARPEAPDQYKLPESELLDTNALASSPVVELWRKAAHEAGLGQEQFEKVIEDYAKTEAERMGAQIQAEKTALGENADARLEAVGAWVNKTFEGDELAAVHQVATTAAGVKALEKLMGKSIEGSPSDGGDPGDNSDAPTEAEIRALMNTKEYYSPHHRDPKVVAKVEKFFQSTYGKKS